MMHYPHHGMQVAARWVCGAPLEPGERVIYFRRIDHTGRRVSRIAVGVLLAPFVVGLFMLYAVFKDMTKEPDAQAITNRRLLAIKNGGVLVGALRWEEVTGFTKVLRRTAEPTMMVRNAAGPQLHFASDGPWLERTLPMWRETPMYREQAPEVPFA
ncbi:MAG: hypothetical protein JWP97_518 [Labilithrix sp.]|nr:hypothetical protein [Labilithrix sp.]